MYCTCIARCVSRRIAMYRMYSLRLKINAILGPNTKTMLCVKLPKYLLSFVRSGWDVNCLFENLLEIILSFVVCGSKFTFFVGQNLNSRITIILAWRKYVYIDWRTCDRDGENWTVYFSFVLARTCYLPARRFPAEISSGAVHDGGCVGARIIIPYGPTRRPTKPCMLVVALKG